MRLTPEKFREIKYDEKSPYIQRSIAKINDAFVRIHRVGAPPPGLNRINTDDPDDDRLTFVLVHGIGLSSTYMIPLAQELAEYGEVMLLDLPGFGDVPPPNRELTIEGFATVIDGAMRLNGVNDPILVGHSMGAQIVVELMARNPERYKRACLVGPPVNKDERSIGRVLARYIESAVHEKSNLVRVAVWSYLRSVTRWVLQIMPSMLSYPIEERINRTAPDSKVVIVSGEHDYLVPRNWALYLAEQAGDCDIFTLPNAAHSTLYNNDDSVARLILTLLTEKEAQGAGKRHW